MPKSTLNSPHGDFAVPRHVAIIMDGNGRWAAARGLPRSVGHRRGVEALRRTVRAAGPSPMIRSSWKSSIAG